MLSLASFGAVWGASIAFVAVALGLSWRVLGILDFGLAAVYAVVAYLQYTAVRDFGIAVWLAAPLALIGGIALQFVIYRAVYAHFLRTRQSLATVVLLSLAVLYVCQNILVLCFGSAGQVILTTPPVRLQLGALSMLAIDLATVVSLLVVLGLLYLLFVRTRLGLAMRGMAVNPELARTLGVSPERVRAMTFCLTGAIVAVPAIIGSLYDPITPTIGFNPILFAFAAFVIASVRSGLGIAQYALCGVALGLVTGLSLLFIPSQWQLAVPFAAMVVVTVVRRNVGPVQRAV
jgi:branched-subunit amino acid ABC-type transport system permease component